MLVYGDQRLSISIPEALDADARERRRIGQMDAGLARHAALVGLFIEAAKRLQGVADVAFDTSGVDDASPAVDALVIDLLALARQVDKSWSSGFDLSEPPPIGPLYSEALPRRVEIRNPEGYTYYGLYPEAYAVAARTLCETGQPFQVIGIRSIGTGLASLAAAALDAPPPITVRPVGHPFARELRLGEGLIARLLDHHGLYLVVDEGPGLSGSSFAAVADPLRSRGVAADRIIFMPSHGGDPGSEASGPIRQRWAEVRRRPVEMNAVVSDRRVAAWAETLLGPLQGELLDLSAGGWRGLRFADAADWSAIDPRTERRKLLVRNAEGPWLLKFAGLGTVGERKLERGQALARAGLIPEVRGLVHGFIVQRWIEDTSEDAKPGVQEIARYLGARARLLEAPTGGASLSDLIDMAAFNAGEELGEAAGRRLRRRFVATAELQAMSLPVAIDGRCDRADWLRSRDGRLLKADALDHDADHDLVGAQDLAWDVVGATVELDLSPSEGDQLAAETGIQAETPVPPALVRLLTPCYLAFRMGAARLAQQAHGGQPDEAARSDRAARRCADRLRSLLA